MWASLRHQCMFNCLCMNHIDEYTTGSTVHCRIHSNRNDLIIISLLHFTACDVNCASGCAIQGPGKCDSSCKTGYFLLTSFATYICKGKCSTKIQFMLWVLLLWHCGLSHANILSSTTPLHNTWSQTHSWFRVDSTEPSHSSLISFKSFYFCFLYSILPSAIYFYQVRPKPTSRCTWTNHCYRLRLITSLMYLTYLTVEFSTDCLLLCPVNDHYTFTLINT